MEVKMRRAKKQWEGRDEGGNGLEERVWVRR